MKIVDAFLFSEPHEKEVLLLKLMLSNSYVDEWVLCENAYTHQGDYKGLTARKLIEGDERFAPYINKITLIEREQPFEVLDKTKVLDRIAFKAENWQRSLAYPYFIEHYDDSDWIAINDADEIFDFTDERRVKEFFKNLKGASREGVLTVPRMRFWYDFDNQHLDIHSSVLCTKAFLLANKTLTLSAIRNKYTAGYKNIQWDNIILFEYSTCFSLEHIVRKLETNPHTGISRETLLQALRCNHRTVHINQIKKKLKPNKKFFFETVELNENNSPLYVRQNLAQLKTNVIDKNYRENRKKDYPWLYTFYYPCIEGIKTMYGKLTKKITKKWAYILKRLGLKK